MLKRLCGVETNFRSTLMIAAIKPVTMDTATVVRDPDVTIAPATLNNLLSFGLQYTL
jgi:hypothetical protein